MTTVAQDLMFRLWLDDMALCQVDLQRRLSETDIRLDFTRRSLEDLERYMRERWESTTRFRSVGTRDLVFTDLVTRYVGNTLLAARGTGHWFVDHDRKATRGRVYVHLGDGELKPIAPLELLHRSLDARFVPVLPEAYDQAASQS